MYEIIARDYQDYLLDLALNQITVHWCGHSRQSTPVAHYASHISALVRESLRLCNFLK